MNTRRQTFIILIVVFVCAGIVWWSMVVVRQTGLLVVTASVPQATISISQSGHEALIIGTGKAKVRLKPGSYQVVAKAGAERAVSLVNIDQRQKTTSNLRLSSLSIVPSAEDIDFQHTDILIDAGVSSDQLSILKKSFFKFKPTANKVVLDINTLQETSRRPFTDDPFILNFNVLVDGQNYRASIDYTNLDDLRLNLYDPQTGNIVFDSWADRSGSQ